jgi:hypothetical protein
MLGPSLASLHLGDALLLLARVNRAEGSAGQAAGYYRSAAQQYQSALGPTHEKTRAALSATAELEGP